ncbi:general substrate transporter [Tuber indicum]|nr:general substrate transporter [Tuber indicum]
MPATMILYTLDLAAGTALFGWNLAELNAPQRAIQDNLGLNAAQFGLASSVLAIGGLVGSVLAAPAMNAFGRKKILISSASVFGLAGICKASAGGAAALTVGRFLGGMAAGTAAVIVPIYINELAPPNYKGAFGALTQISINLGILSSQVLGVFLEHDGQ